MHSSPCRTSVRCRTEHSSACLPRQLLPLHQARQRQATRHFLRRLHSAARPKGRAAFRCCEGVRLAVEPLAKSDSRHIVADEGLGGASGGMPFEEARLATLRRRLPSSRSNEASGDALFIQYGNPQLYRQFDQRAGTESPRRGARGTYAPGVTARSLSLL
jgi:hypothetical protein